MGESEWVRGREGREEGRLRKRMAAQKLTLINPRNRWNRKNWNGAHAWHNGGHPRRQQRDKQVTRATDFPDFRFDTRLLQWKMNFGDDQPSNGVAFSMALGHVAFDLHFLFSLRLDFILLIFSLSLSPFPPSLPPHFSTCYRFHAASVSGGY